MGLLHSSLVVGFAALSFAASACGGGSSSDGGTGGADGAGAADGAQDGGNVDTAGEGGGEGGGSNPCGVAGEIEPNETRDTATPYTLGTTVVGCVASAMDHDFYEFTAPATDTAGGYIQIAIGDVGDGNIDFQGFAASDNGEISRQYSTSRGMSLLGWLALAPGQKYRIDIRDFAGFNKAYRYMLKLTYTKIDDSYEPNDNKDKAKPLPYPATIEARLYTGYTNGGMIKGAEYDDWYAITLPSGMVTIKVENVATDIYGDLELYDATGKKVDRQYASTKGASLTMMQPVAAGDYTIRAGVFSAAPDGTGKDPTPPDHFTRAYKLSAVVSSP